MAVTVKTAATTRDLIKLSVVQIELCLDNDPDEQLLKRLIREASAWVESCIGRPIVQEEFTETWAGSEKTRWILSRHPVKTVSEVRFDAEAQDVTSYALEDAEAGLLFREKGWRGRPRFNQQIASEFIEKGELIWAVDYTAGWKTEPQGGAGAGDTALPLDIETAALEYVKLRFAGRDRDPAIKSEGILDFRTTYHDGVPEHIKGLLNPYREFA